MTKTAPNENLNSKISVESLQPHLTPEQYEEVKQARLKAIQAAANDRLSVLNSEISDNTKSVLNAKTPNWQEIVEERSMLDKASDAMDGVLDKAEALPVVGGLVSAARSPLNTVEGVQDALHKQAGTDREFVVNNDVVAIFKEEWIWAGLKYLFSQIKGIFSAGFSLDAFSRLGDFLKGDMNTGKKVSELVSHYDKMLDLAIADEAIWKNAMLDKGLLDISLDKLRMNMNVQDIAKTLELEDISHGDVKDFLKKFFEAKNFEKIIADYKAKSGVTEIDEKNLTLKDIFLKAIENPSK